MSDTHRHTNALAREKSPYLLQHAHNPVDWMPWGEEAFARARAEDKPLFVSIGYATCHWCHVMERESFENEASARLLNEHFVCVKVDREERPDIDAVYMTACQLMTGSGGWPLNVVLTPQGAKPFFAATYLPRESRFGRMGLADLVPRLDAAWRGDRENTLGAADRVAEAMAAAHGRGDGAGGDLAAASLPAAAENALAGEFDAVHGGFGKAPKFPSPHHLVLLLARHRATGEAAPLAMAEKTLRRMRLGGLFDHVGYGFHRYSTDREWLLPHFEKMLYDQAMHLIAYAEAHALTREALYRNTADEVATYVLRDLASPQGAFYAAEDADSEGEEGAFYVFTIEDAIHALAEGGLSRAEAARAVELYGMAEQGNFRDEASGERGGANIAHLAGEPGPAEVSLLERARAALFAARASRPRPLLDDKILTDWNGLMIGALARAGRLLENPAYVDAAARAAAWITANLRDGQGALLHRHRDGEAAIPAMLDDFAFLAFGLAELYEATGEAAHLAAALELVEEMRERFEDPQGGFFLVAADARDLPVRPREAHDGAYPAGNSMAAFVLARLARLADRPDLADAARAAVRSAGDGLERVPQAFCALLWAVDELEGGGG